MTKDERFAALIRLGCIACLLKRQVHSAACIHHLLGIKYRATGKKAHWSHTIPLCPTDHDGNHRIFPSAHKQPALFRAVYGTQEFLLNEVNKRIGWTNEDDKKAQQR